MIRIVLPTALLAALLSVLALGISGNPQRLPAPRGGVKLPAFALVQLRDPTRQISEKELRGRVSLLNVWATWCVPCRQEHEMLMRIARETHTPIYGLNYKDSRANALRWLDQLGNPYLASAFDHDGTLARDLGVVGTPETFVVDKHGAIAYKHVGRLTESAWTDILLPIIQALRNADS